MKNCDSTRESLGAWLDGELDRAESEAVRVHLEGCVACKEERKQLEKLQVALKSVLDSEASRIAFPSFWSSVQQRITEKSAWREDLVDWMRSVIRCHRNAWAIPAVLLLLIGLLNGQSLVFGLRTFG